MTVNYGGGGSGKGRTDLASGVVQFAGSDSPIPSDEIASFKGKTVLYFPILISPITVSYNLSGVSKPEADGAGHRGHLPGQDHEVERPGDQGDQPRRQAAQHRDHHRPPFGLVGHDSELLRVPRGGRARRLEARQQLHHQLARHQPGRQRQRRGGADHQEHPRGHRVRGLRRRQGLRADLRLHQEQGRQLRRAVGLCRHDRRRRRHRQPEPHVQRDLGARRHRLPDHRQSWVLAYQKQSSANTTKLLKAYFGYLVGDGQKLLPGLGYAPLPSSIDQKAKAQLSKIGS